jgi:uncharacterized damage-inducible protein DinB
MDPNFISNHLLDLAKYNLWANRRIEKIIAEISKDQILAKVTSSFPSVHQTVMHIRDAEWVWLQRVRENKFTELPFANLDPAITLEEYLHGSAVIVQEIEKWDDAHCHSPLTYHNLKGISSSNTRFQMLVHCFNHSTYHRGQLVTLTRQAGAEHIPSTDYIEYLRQ